YFDNYESTRTHLSLGKDASPEQAVQASWTGPIVAISQVGACIIATNGSPPKEDTILKANPSFAYSVFAVKQLNTFSERLRRESRYFRVIERTATSPIAHE